ncbi:hypothetical protein CDAR_465261 [Caerostris darwini]|uniref:Uncharacterized protein n=1 Tax=Caerostris darwini TaxID=1538125 RepID=A0AAV4SL07_9ARAC|nr:hypothetical protein CDAR_465261 [Caerostris darwini]
MRVKSSFAHTKISRKIFVIKRNFSNFLVDLQSPTKLLPSNDLPSRRGDVDSRRQVGVGGHGPKDKEVQIYPVDGSLSTLEVLKTDASVFEYRGWPFVQKPHEPIN